MKGNKLDQKGFNLIEVCIGILILAVIVIAAVNLMRARTSTFELNETNRGAIEAADEMLDKLSAQASELPDGGTFVVEDVPPGESDPTILSSSFKVDGKCNEKWCDYVLNTPESASPKADDQPHTTVDSTGGSNPKNGGGIIDKGEGNREPKPSALGGFYPKPQGSDIRFFRRWSVKTIDRELKLKVITVAILTDEKANEPLLVEQTIIGSAK